MFSFKQEVVNWELYFPEHAGYPGSLHCISGRIPRLSLIRHRLYVGVTEKRNLFIRYPNLPTIKCYLNYHVSGVEEMRRSVTGRYLPGARHVSFRLFPDADLPDVTKNMVLVYWGQFVDHDLTLTAITEVPTDEGSTTNIMIITESYNYIL